jgi:hypothetical protein
MFSYKHQSYNPAQMFSYKHQSYNPAYMFSYKHQSYNPAQMFSYNPAQMFSYKHQSYNPAQMFSYKHQSYNPAQMFSLFIQGCSIRRQWCKDNEKANFRGGEASVAGSLRGERQVQHTARRGTHCRA